LVLLALGVVKQPVEKKVAAAKTVQTLDRSGIGIRVTVELSRRQGVCH